MVRLNLQLFAVTTSIVDLLKSQGKDYSFSARQKLAHENGITNYSGTAEQNKQLIGIVQGGTKPTTPTTPTTSKTTTSNTTKKSTPQIKLNGVDQSVADRMNKQWQAPTAYQDAMVKVQSMLEQIQSGKTSYTDQLKGIMDKINNREEFKYDVDSDQLFQQYLSSMMATGQTAMQDTIGQASALTGGYGSSYATSAGNQAYNAYIQEAYNNLPEYYQMARDTYQMEGDELYRQYGMLYDADATEWNRNLESYNATYANANDIYDKAFGEYSFDVNQATQIANMQNSDYWTKMNYDQSQSQFISANDLNGDGKVDSKDHDLSYQRSISGSSRSGSTTKRTTTDKDGNTVEIKDVSESQMKKALEAYNKGGQSALDQYVDSLPANIDIDSIDAYINKYGQLPLEQRTFTKTKDTFNWLWGNDNNDIVKDQYGNEYRIDELPKSIRKALTDLKEGKSYTSK